MTETCPGQLGASSSVVIFPDGRGQHQGLANWSRTVRSLALGVLCP